MLLKLVALSVFFFVTQHVLRRVYNLGLHLHFNEHYPGTCQKVQGIGYGSEGGHIFSDGLTFITSGFGCDIDSEIKKEFDKANDVRGRIYLFDFKSKSKSPELLTIVGGVDGFNAKNLRPHGISGWLDKTGKKLLFVVSHDVDGKEYIEKFRFIPEKKQLQHIQRYQDQTMTVLNDVQATGEDSFYFTNSGASQNRVWFLLIAMSGLPWTNMVSYDNKSYRVVLDGLNAANGIAISKDGRHVYVADLDQSVIIVAERKPNNDLTVKQRYQLNSHPDNIIVDIETDNLFIGAHPIGYKAYAHLDNPNLKAPSQVLSLRVENGNITNTRELFYDHGEMITGSSFAIVANQKLLIGSVMDTMVLCDVKVPYL